MRMIIRITKFTFSITLFFLVFSTCKKHPSKEAEASAPEKFIAENAKVYVTARDTSLRLALTGTVNFSKIDQPRETDVCVFVNPLITFQTMVGIGGAITDASAETFAKLPESSQKELLAAYYDEDDGIGYNFARTNIGSCDFSSSSYSYVEDNDSLLRNFSIAHDEEFRIPMIRQAMSAASRPLHLFASPWSPPAWMKDNNSVLNGGKLLKHFRHTWAKYMVKFIKSYEKAGIQLWGLSVQNEPMAVQKWESCVFTAEEERDFIKKYLGPKLMQNSLRDIKLIVWDHNRDLIFQRASTILDDPEAAQYVWGVGFHWYETWTGGGMQFNNLKLVHEAYPNVNLVFTEGCVEKFSPDHLKDWSLGEKYGYSMVNDFNCGTVAWTDWNILLDENGGPNHVGNFCFAPIHANTKTGKLTYTNSYYYIGHFSKFIREGAQRIAASSNREKLQTTAFINTDGKVAVIVLNTSDEKLPYKLCFGKRATDLISLPHSIMTVIL